MALFLLFVGVKYLVWLTENNFGQSWNYVEYGVRFMVNSLVLCSYLEKLPGLRRFPGLSRCPGLRRLPGLKRFPGLRKFPGLTRFPGLKRSPVLYSYLEKLGVQTSVSIICIQYTGCTIKFEVCKSVLKKQLFWILRRERHFPQNSDDFLKFLLVKSKYPN